MDVVALVDGEVDLVERVCRRAGQTTRLRPRQVQVLAYLAERPGRTVTRDELVEAVMLGAALRQVDTAVSRLRRAIEADPARPVHVVSVVGEGYRFEPVRRQERRVHGPAAPRLLGRDADLAAVHAALGRSRLVTLVGVGGVGKTGLALGAAHSTDLPRVRFASLASARDRSELLEVLGRAFGVDVASSEAVGRALITLLEGRSGTLLVLDNLEQLDADARAWLQGLVDLEAPRILATSRSALGLDGEEVFSVAPLSDDAAAALLRRVAEEQGVALRDDAPLGPMVEQLDGLPLALELAGARIPALGVQGTARHLAERLRLLRRTGGQGSERQRSLQGSLDVSWELLGPPLRDGLARASVFVGAIGPDAARAVLGADAAEVLGQLQAASLVQPGGPRLLGIVREWAAVHARELGVADEAHRSLGRWLLSVTPEVALFDGLDVERIEILEARQEQLSHTFRALLQPDPELAVTLALRLVELYNAGASDRLLQTVDAVLPSARSLDHPLQWLLRARRGGGLTNLGRLAEAEVELEEAASLAPTDLARAYVASLRADVLGRRGLPDEACAVLLPFAEVQGFAAYLPIFLASQERNRNVVSDRVEARLRAGVVAADQGSSAKARGLMRANLGLYLLRIGALDEAEELLLDAADLLDATGRVGYAEDALSNLHLTRGDPERALVWAKRAVASFRRMGNPHFGVLNHAALHLHLGQPEVALTLLESVPRATPPDSWHHLRHVVRAIALAMLGQVGRAEDELADARRWASGLAVQPMDPEHAWVEVFLDEARTRGGPADAREAWRERALAMVADDTDGRATVRFLRALLSRHLTGATARP